MHSMIGVFWGAFDPPTKAHAAIINAALATPEIDHILIVINNHSYKNYFIPLEKRRELLFQMIGHYIPEKITLLYQDDEHPINFTELEKITSQPLCAIAGYDAYLKWTECSSSKERANYQAIAVVPRGDAHPNLFDESAFLLPIDSSLKHVSSSDYKRDSRF